MRSAVTLSLVSQSKGGPFVFWDDLGGACQKAAALGFDAVEIFAPGAQAVAAETVRPLLEQHNLRLAALDAGGGRMWHRRSIDSRDSATGEKARAFSRYSID